MPKFRLRHPEVVKVGDPFQLNFTISVTGAVLTPLPHRQFRRFLRRFQSLGTSSPTEDFSGEAVGRALVFEEYGPPAATKARLKVHICSSATLSVYFIRRYERRAPEADELEIRFLAAPVNPSDINQIEGVYPKPPRFVPGFGAVGGDEGVAQVVRVGSAIEHAFSPGQWVLPAKPGFGTWRTFATLSASLVQALPCKPNGISLAQAATLSVNPCTAYRLLIDFGKVPKGGYVIQNGANSGVGRMVIQLCRLWGLRSINIVRERPQLELLREELRGLGADHVVSDVELRDPETRGRLKRLEPALGLNCVGGRVVTEMVRLLAPGAALVTYGGMSREPVTLPTSLLIFNKLTFKGFWMTRWLDECYLADPAPRHAMLEALVNLMGSNQLRPPPHRELSWGDQLADPDLLAKCLQAFQRPAPGSFSPPKPIFIL
ncbi:mitochondrial 2-enoyl thioester reductase [Massospora cicadina]|nr:mitochondrial 2-enoyl thioester reductase [Massospora cicadina]